jgi:hypothetical protein
MMLSEIIHSSPDKFTNINNYHNFKRKIQQAQQSLRIASLYLNEREINEWGIDIKDAIYQLDRFVFED